MANVDVKTLSTGAKGRRSLDTQYLKCLYVKIITEITHTVTFLFQRF